MITEKELGKKIDEFGIETFILINEGFIEKLKFLKHQMNCSFDSELVNILIENINDNIMEKKREV